MVPHVGLLFLLVRKAFYIGAYVLATRGVEQGQNKLRVQYALGCYDKVGLRALLDPKRVDIAPSVEGAIERDAPVGERDDMLARAARYQRAQRACTKEQDNRE